MIGSTGCFATPSRRRWQGGRGLGLTLVLAALGSALLACDRDPGDASSGKPATMPPSAATGEEPTERNPSSSGATDVLDLDSLFTESLVAQQGTCLPTERAPGRSRLVYSLLPSQASYLRLTVVASPDGTRPVIVDLARGLSGGRILYATLAPGAAAVRLQTFSSASDKRPLVTDLPLGHPVAQHLLLLGERALTLPCRGA